MPPKKKQGGDGEKKKGKKDKKPVVGPPAPQPLSDDTKEFYLVQIRDLENRIERYQKKCDELEVKNGEFHSKFEKLTDDKKDIVLFIKKKLDEKTDEISEANEQLMSLQQAKDTEKDGFEKQLLQLRTEFQETKDQLTSENMMLGGKLASLEEFKLQREELMAKLEALEQELFETDRQHKLELYNVEKKQVIDKDRLKRDMIQQVNQVAAEFRKISNRQMAETTKRTIRENVTINAQLIKLSEKTMEMIEENDGLKDRARKQRQQIEILEANEKQLAKKNVCNQKTIQMLADKCRTQEQAIRDFDAKKEQYNVLEAEINLLKLQLENTRMETLTTDDEYAELEKQLSEKQEEVSNQARFREQLEKLMNEAVSALHQVTVEPVAEDCSDTPSDVGTKRQMAIQNLIRLLNGSLELEKEKRQAESAAVARSSGSASSDPVGRYQLGDLGLIPRPQHHIPTSFDKVRQSEMARESAYRRTVGKSVGTQTASTAKAMFLADQLICKFPSSKDHVNTSKNAASAMTRSLPPIVIPVASRQFSAKMH